MIWPFKRDAGRSADAPVASPPQQGLEHEIAKNLGNSHKAAGDLDKAVDCYRRSLAIAPDYVPSLYNLGLVLHERRRLEEAEALFRRVHEIAPGDADALVHLGAILCKRARFEEGAEMFRAALRLSPEDAKLWLLLARACREIPHRIDESIECLRKCLTLDPGLVEAHCELGVAFRKLGDATKAAEAFGKALELLPGSPEAIGGLGAILQDEGRIDETIEHYRAAIRSWPDSASLYNGLGCGLLLNNRTADAADCFRKAIGLQPDFADALYNLGVVHGLRGERDQALRCFADAARLKPGDPLVLECLLFEKQHVCDWTNFAELSVSRRRVHANPAQAVSPFSLLSIPSTRAEQLRCARDYAKSQIRAVAHGRPKFEFVRRARSKLRIGYLSSDLHEHATAYLMAEMFELHDRSRFEIQAYSYGQDDGSPMRARLRRAFDRFTDIGPLSHAAAAAAVHADGTDILVDLKGYTEHARTGIVALRPAPVQASYLGYPGTMGAEFIDYLIADRFVVPAEHAADYSEQLVLLPGSYQVNDRKRPIAETPPRRDLGLPESAFVFCCFNQAYKILPDTFAVWMRLLQAVPGSVLWLLESNPWAAQNLRREAQARGVDPQRLVFAPKLPLDRHLGRMRAADLFLDTLPYNAHTTASDALWAGLPVLSVPGDTFASRVAGSLLSAVGMPELIAGSIEGYEALALKLAREPDRLAALRGKLARNRDSTSLFDTPAFVRGLEAAYEEMWRQFLSGAGPLANAPSSHAAKDAASRLARRAGAGAAVSAQGERIADLLRQATEHQRGGEDGAAEECFREILALQPEHPAASRLLAHWLAFQAHAHQERGEADAAIEGYEESLALDPGQAQARNNLGNLYKEQGRIQEAVAAYRDAVAIDAGLAEAHLNLGLALLHAGENQEAIACLRRALELRPSFAEAGVGLGYLLEHDGDAAGALECYRGAIAARPDYAEAHFNYALQLLLHGEYRNGWREHEWRVHLPGLGGGRPEAVGQRWDGSALDGRNILLYAEQGFGDAIQFARYAPMVAEMGGRVMLRCRPKLKALLESVPGISAVMSTDEPLPAFDVCCSLMSLPLLFDTTLETIPAGMPYIRPDAEKALRWKSRLGADDAPLKVGLYWSTDAKSKIANLKSLTLEMLAPLANIPGVTYYSLQRGAAAAEAARPPPGMTIFDLSAELEDFSDDAALMANLDLVVSIDTATAHLAGAMGRRVWTLTHFPPDWRWLLGRDDSPWYPTMRLFRQGRAGTWEEVISRLGQAVRHLAGRGTG